MTDPAQTASPARPVVVVLGSGRSGTSLLMQVLAALGLRVSPDLIEARRDNPRGFFEDARIVRIQADLMRALGAWPYHALPPDWLEAPATDVAARALREVLRENLDRDGLWGFKDPRTAPFLPLWQRLFAEESLEPRYILALRAPGCILRSFMAAYRTPLETAEAVWLRRTCDALRHTRAACHIVHYEDWFTRGAEVASGLARYTGLAGNADDLPDELVRPDLNRAGGGERLLGDPAARALDAALAGCRGDGFDRNSLLAAVAASCPDREPVDSPPS